MQYHDEWLQDGMDEALRQSFQAYFTFLGINVTNWDGLFDEIIADANVFLVRRDEAGQVMGFLLSTVTEAAAWKGFFTAKLGFVQEFYIAPAHRGHGHGSELLKMAEECFQAEGCLCSILTSDTAEDFYLRQGYVHAPGVKAKNGIPVFVKRMGT